MIMSDWGKLTRDQRNEIWPTLTHAESDVVIEPDRDVVNRIDRLPSEGSPTLPTSEGGPTRSTAEHAPQSEGMGMGLCNGPILLTHGQSTVTRSSC